MTSQASDSNCFVRPARVEDLEAMGIAHAGAMLATLQAGSSQELPVSVSAMITPAVLADSAVGLEHRGLGKARYRPL